VGTTCPVTNYTGALQANLIYGPKPLRQDFRHFAARPEVLRPRIACAGAVDLDAAVLVRAFNVEQRFLLWFVFHNGRNAHQMPALQTREVSTVWQGACPQWVESGHHSGLR
jgi:hypothetical protein